MARKAKQLDASVIDDRSRLIEALSFVSFTSKDDDVNNYSYISIKDGRLSAADQTITMGSPISVDLELCLHGAQFKAALEQCGPNFQFTQIDSAGVSIRSDKFRALVPAIPNDLLSDNTPDEAIAALDDRIKLAFETCGSLVKGTGERAQHLALLLRSGSAVGTNGSIALEYWHGIDLPPGLLIPKRALQAVTKTKKPLAAFGYSPHSVTFWFDDGSFIKTKLIAMEFPNVDKVLDVNFANKAFHEKPSDFYKALGAINSFVVDDTVHFHDNHMATHHTLDLGASYRVDGLKTGLHLSAKGLKFIEEYTASICLDVDSRSPIPFHNATARGLILGKTS